MAKNKMSVKKNCPFCGLQVAVASKNCPKCNHSFYQAKRISLGLVTDPSTSSTEDGVAGAASSSRRTSRVKREKPNYYDASEFEKKTKKKRLPGNPRGRPPNNPQTHGLKTKKKRKHHKIVRDVEEDDEPIVLNAEKLVQCSIILAELNRKFVGTTFRV